MPKPARASATDAALALQTIRINLLTETIDDFDTLTFSLPMFLEALAILEQAQRKLEQAELFRARESAGNF